MLYFHFHFLNYFFLFLLIYSLTGCLGVCYLIYSYFRNNIIQFTIASKTIKYLGINITKEMKNLYDKKYNTLIKEIKEERNKWKDILCLWIGKLILLKCPHYSKLSIDLMQYQSKWNSTYYRNRKKYYNLYEITKDPVKPKRFL